MRLVYSIAALLCVAAASRADTPQYVLLPDGTVEQRVAKVESEVDSLKARVADLERQLGSVAAPAAPAPKAKAPAKVRYSVCSNGRCTIYEADAGTPIPAGATLLSGTSAATGSPCPTGPCGDSCGCAGAATESTRSGWFPGKLLGRRR